MSNGLIAARRFVPEYFTTIQDWRQWASSRPPSGYDDQRLADDVFATIEGAKIQQPILIAHSMAGGEMTTLARNHSDRVSALVYLDALGDLEDDPSADPEWSALQKKVPPDLRPQPVCNPVDTSTFAAFQKSMACRRGSRFRNPSCAISLKI